MVQQVLESRRLYIDVFEMIAEKKLLGRGQDGGVEGQSNFEIG